MKKVALTFDDGPNPLATEKILEILKKNQTFATFFVVGQNVQNYPEIAKRIKAEGHEVAIHSYKHSPYLSILPPKLIRDDLTKTLTAIKKATGKTPKYFRPPHGFQTPWLIKTVKKLGLETVMWSVDLWDAWPPGSTSNRILNRLEGQLKPGGIILLHDGNGTSNTDSRTETVIALPKVIKYIKEKGYEFVSVAELASD